VINAGGKREFGTKGEGMDDGSSTPSGRRSWPQVIKLAGASERKGEEGEHLCASKSQIREEMFEI